MGRNPKSKNELGSVRKSFSLIERIKELDGAGVSQLARDLEWPKSTVHVHLETLHNTGYIVKKGDIYFLGYRFLELGEYVRYQDKVLQLVEPRIKGLAEETGERVQFFVLERGDIIYARISEGEHAVNTGSHLGRRIDAVHATAGGKAILAFTDRERVEELIDDKGLPRRTENTITDKETFFEELDEIRERGYAFNREENTKGLHAIASPVLLPHGEVAGALSLPGPAHRLRGAWFTDELPETILGICNEIELDLAHQ